MSMLIDLIGLSEFLKKCKEIFAAKSDIKPQVQADWSQPDEDNPSYIRNKPSGEPKAFNGFYSDDPEEVKVRQDTFLQIKNAIVTGKTVNILVDTGFEEDDERLYSWVPVIGFKSNLWSDEAPALENFRDGNWDIYVILPYSGKIDTLKIINI